MMHFTDQYPETAFKESNMQVQVEGMTCGHCVKAVTRAITELDSAAKVNVDLGAGRVDVESRLSPSEISAAITDAGYTVKGATA